MSVELERAAGPMYRADLASAPSSSAERALALVALAALRIADRQVLQARPLVVEARVICEALAAPATLVALRALEARIAASPTLPPLALLSRRERDVLRLVTQGLTDAEVAAELALSRRTVTTHLTSIYTKFAVSSRTAAVRIALEHGLS